MLTLLEKSKMASLSPFESTLYLDADTVVLGNLDYAFERAEEFGLACCICECPWMRRYGAELGDLIEYNTGVLFFTNQSRPVFDAWQELAGVCPSQSHFVTDDGREFTMPYEDQSGFARAVRQCRCNPYVLPLNYNFRPGFHREFFAPLKIWHYRLNAPAALFDRNAACENGTRPVSHIRLKNKPAQPVEKAK